MTVTTAETLSVNGVVLNTLAKNIESLTGRLKVPGIRTENITLPGRHGSLRTTQKKYQEGEIILPMWVRGTDDDGQVISTQRRHFYENVDTLTRLFRPGGGLLSVVHTLPDGSSRRAWAESTEMIDFSVMGGSLGKFSVALRVPSVFWEDVNLSSVDLPAAFNGPVTALAGSTAPIEDGVFKVIGPITNPTIEAMMDGVVQVPPVWLRYSDTISASQTLTLNCANWTLSSTGGLVVDYSKLLHVGGTRWLTLVPGTTVPTPSLKFTGSAGTTSATKLNVSARRKFLVG